MFNFFKRKIDSEELKENVKISLENQKKLVKFFEDYTILISEALEQIKKSASVNQDWGREFHRMLLNEYAQYPQNRVYGMVYIKSVHTTTDVVDTRKPDKRIVLTVANTFEEAQVTGAAILARENEDPNNWSIEGYQHLSLPITDKNLAVEVDKKLYNTSKPIGVFLNDLMFVKDRFAFTPSEKKTLSNIIKRIEQTQSVESK